MKKLSLFATILVIGALPALSQTMVAASGVAAPAQYNTQAERGEHGYVNSEIFEGNGMVG